MNFTAIATFAALSICALSACAPLAPTFDQNFGDNVRALQAQQVRNPEAPVANRDKLPDGLDGRAAHQAYEEYERSFTTPARTTNFTIGIGTGVSQ